MPQLINEIQIYKVSNCWKKSIELPVIPVIFDFGEYPCLIDSGSDHSYLNSIIGQALGLDIARGREYKSKGITGVEFLAYFHKIKFKVGGWEYEAEFGFSSDVIIHFGILGREDFFNLFKVIIENPQKLIELRPYN